MFTSEIRDEKNTCFRMKDMKPLQVAKIVDGDYPYYSNLIVMRTASTSHFEVMVIWPNPKVNSCWTGENCNLLVQLLHPGTKIILTVKEED